MYNGLFLNLPFEHVRSSGIMLPVFTSYCREQLEAGHPPDRIVWSFFKEKMNTSDFEEITDTLFTFMQIVERQVVLFDALEDAGFDKFQDIDGAGSVKELLNRVAAREAEQTYRELLEEYRTRIVLTAHPTQFYPDEVLAIITDLAQAIEGDDLKRIYDLLLQMGKTRFKNKRKPTPVDEAKSLLWYLENVFYDTLPTVQQKMLEPVLGPTELPIDIAPNVELGFWPGGDRDGNPYVTAEVTTEIGDMLRTSILRRYQRDLVPLQRRLTFPGVTERLEEIAEKLALTVNPLIRVADAPDADGSYCEDLSEDAYASAEEFLADLREIHRMLVRDHMGLFTNELSRFMLKVHLFGFHFATMDIRQDSRVHRRVMAEIMESLGPRTEASLPFSDYANADIAERIRCIEAVSELETDAQELLSQLASEESADALKSVRAARYIRDYNGTRGVHRYIISNTQSAADILDVWLLAQLGECSELDIVPLFETIEDLYNAPQIMERLYDHPKYAAHLAKRSSTQTIMVGFSDGTKDGGYVTANWEIYRAKQRLTETARRHDIHVIFFDGRGGPPARGGGNTHKFYRSLGQFIDSKQIHLTVQGQTISSKYGTPAQCIYNVEQLVSAGLENTLFPEDTSQLTEDDLEFLDIFSAKCCEAYLELKRHPSFVDYLQHYTPLRFYGETNIASRPTSRGGSDILDLDTLRAIPFVGAWSQMKQNIPGFYGFGSGLEFFIKEGERDRLKDLYRRSPFFRTLVENSMQSLSKTYYPLTQYMESDPNCGEFWRLLRDEAQRTTRLLCEISGQSDLLSGDPTLKESIELREEMIRPVETIQQYALQELRDGGEADNSGPTPEQREKLKKMVVKSLAASVNASRNAV